jgi:hypothetical protein
MADNETDEGESGIVAKDDLRGRRLLKESLWACFRKLGELRGGFIAACKPKWARRAALCAGGALGPASAFEDCTVVVRLVTGETVTWAGAAPAGLHCLSPGGMSLLPGTLGALAALEREGGREDPL